MSESAGKPAHREGRRACEREGIMNLDSEEAGRGRTKAWPALERRKDQEQEARRKRPRAPVRCEGRRLSARARASEGEAGASGREQQRGDHQGHGEQAQHPRSFSKEAASKSFAPPGLHPGSYWAILH